MAWSGRRQVPDSGRPGRARGERHGRGRGRWQWPGGHSRVLGSAAGLPGLSPAVPQAVRGTLPRPTLIPGSAAASSRAQVFAGERTELRLRSGAATRMKATSSARWQALQVTRSEEHTSELQSLMRNSYDVFCLKTNKKNK